jgi:hypothetical protein
MTVQQLIDELQKAKYKDIQTVEIIWQRIKCGDVIKVWQGEQTIVLEVEIPDSEENL